MSVPDTAVGAILEIPSKAMARIKQANNALLTLHESSRKAANQIYGDFNDRIPRAFDKFIQKITEAREATKGIGNINITLNTNAAVQAGQQLSTQMQKTTADVSQAVQDLSRLNIDTTSIKTISADVQALGMTWKDVESIIKNIEAGRKVSPMEDSASQAMTNMIEKLKEYVALKKKSDEQLARVTTPSDKAVLDEQESLMRQILQLTKDINAESKKQEREKALGRAIPQEDIDRLEKYRQDLEKLNNSYDTLKGKIDSMSAGGARLFNEADVNHSLALTREQGAAQEKLNQALQMTAKLTSDVKLKGGNVTSSEYGVYRNEQVTVYAQMIEMIKKKGDVEAQVAQQGYAQTAAQTNLLQTIDAEYRRLESTLSSVTGKYLEIDRAVKSAFDNTKNMQETENAAKLADAQNKAAVAAQKESDAQAKAEEKAIAAGEKIIAQKEKQIQKEQEATNQAARRDYMSAVERELAVRDSVNRNLEQRIALQQKITALETKQAIAGVKDPTAKMSFTDETRLHSYYAQMQKLDDELKKLTLNYPQLAQASQQAFDAEKVNLLTTSLQKLADAQAKATTSKANTDASAAEDKLNQLYTERLRLLREKEQLENKSLINQAKGGTGLTAKENQLLTELTAKLQSVDSQIKTIGQTYQGLALKAKHAFALDELRQATQLQTQFNTAIDSINTSKAKQLTAEYKRLYAENQRLFESQSKYFDNGGNPVSASIGMEPQDRAYREIEARRQDVLQRMNEIEGKNIQEIADFRLQKEMEANQKSISDFVQAEAQKKAAALQTAQEESNARKQALQTYLQSYQGAMQQADKIMSGRGGTSMFATNIENIKRAINDLKAASGNLNLLNPADVQKAEQLKKKITELETLLKKYKDAATPDKPVISSTDAINAAKNATTLKQLEDAYKQLKTVMANTAQGSDWDKMNIQLGQTKKQIDDIKKKMGEFHNEVQKTSNIMGQLQGRIAAAFSVGALTGFAKKVTEVRAQFELQRVALGAIIKDKDEANKVFLRVQQMALESPFSIMQLERSTKQIAAFGFEAKQLVPTMKMVADIGAGLGVELDRIVLVLGHLKARGYLEGTMVRQFTNMGFNVLGELAKYYTELEGRMVSVADVQERVKKKMVEFGDVEEVLKRVTSAGGMFYDMQKKQSDSIWGQMQRITDAYDLMLNEIGQQNEGSIKAALTAVRTLINSWRTLLPIIKAAGAAMMLYFARISWAAMVAGLAKMTSGFSALRTMIWGTKAAQDALNASQRASGWGTLIALIGAAVVAVWEFATAQSKLNEELERTQSEGISDMYELIFQYRTLADTVKDSTKSYDEHKKALDEIKRVYKDILPDYMTEVEYIKSIKDGYEEVTDAIQAYSVAKIQNQKKEAIDNEYNKEIEDQITHLSAKVAMSLSREIDIPIENLQGKISNIWRVINERIRSGDLDKDKAQKEFQRQIQEVFNISPDVIEKVMSRTLGSGKWGLGPEKELRKIIDDFLSIYDEIEQKYGENTKVGLPGITEESEQLEKDAQPAIEQYHNLEKAVSEYTSAIEALYNRRAELEKQGKTFGTVGLGEVDGQQTFTFPGADAQSQKAMDEVHHKVYLLQQAIASYGYEYKINVAEINRAIQSNMDLTEFMGTVNQNVLGNILKGFQKWGGELVNNPYMANFIESVLNNLNLLTEPQRKIIGIARNVATANGVAMNSFDLLKISAASNYTDAAKEAKKLSDQAADNIKKIAATRTELLMLAKLNHQILTPDQAQQQAEQMWGAGKTEEELKAEQKAYEQLWKALGGYEKEHKKSGRNTDKELKRWQDLKKAIEDVQTAYDKARKSFSVEESNRQIEKLFGPTFKELGADIKDFYKDGTYDAESLIDALEVLLGMTKATTEERKKFRSEMQRKIADTQVEIDVKMHEDSEKKLKADIDRLFDSYDLSKTLKDANIPINLVPMVGGEPIASLDELRDRIQKQFEAEGGENAAENRVKEYKDALKKIDDMEVKQQEESLKSYQQYLAVMYSDRAKTMIKSYTTLKNLERDFASYRANLEKEAADPATTKARKNQIAEKIAKLDQQARDAIDGVKNEMDQKLNQFEWNAFKGSSVFTQMYSDLQTLSNKGIDKLIDKLTIMRKKLQSMENVDYRAVREITQYIEKLNMARIDTSSLGKLFDIVRQSREYSAKGEDAETAQMNLIAADAQLQQYNAEIDSLTTIIALKDQEGNEADKTANLTSEQLALYGKSKTDLQAMLKSAQQNANAAQDNVEYWSKVDNTHKKAQASLKKQTKIAQDVKDGFDKIYDSSLELAEALGADTDEWGGFGKAVSDMIFTVIMLTIQFYAMGVAANSSMGVIGWIAIALQAIVQLLVAIFAMHDNALQKRIEEQQDKVEKLERAYDKLKDAVDSAFEAERLQSDSRKAEQNINDRIKATEEMIRLEKKKKKTDNDQIKEWKQDIADLNDELDEFKESVIEAWGGFGSADNYQSAVEDFTSAWLDAFKETGDGLEALNDKWDEYIDNLIKKQIGLAVMGPRIKRFMKMIDSFVSEESDQGEYLSKSELDQLKALRGSLLDGVNEEMKMYLEYLGYQPTVETILSDLQKGIQNITEPQAAAIEAYLNSMRFAVFRHTEQLDQLIQIVGAQYGVTTDNPVVNELKGIRIVLDSIDNRLDSVIKYDMGVARIQVG